MVVNLRKRICLLAVGILLTGLLSACGKRLVVEDNTVYVQKKGKVTGATLESFDKEYYDEKELRSYVDERVEKYLADNDSKSIKVDNFTIEDNVAKLNIIYTSYVDYAKFNGVEIFSGTIPQALAAGYDFKAEFAAVENGEKGDRITAEEVTENADYKVVVISEKVNVKVDGTIAFVSSENTRIVAKDTVEIKLPEDAIDGEEQTLTYVIYK